MDNIYQKVTTLSNKSLDYYKEAPSPRSRSPLTSEVSGGESLGQPGDPSSTEVMLDLGEDLEEKSNDRSSSPETHRSEILSDSMTEDGKRSPRRTVSSPRTGRRSRSHSRHEGRKMKNVVKKTVCKKPSYKTGVYSYSALKHSSTPRSKNSDSTTSSSYSTKTSSKSKTSRSRLSPDRNSSEDSQGR